MDTQNVWLILWENRDKFIVGTERTLALFIISLLFALIIGIISSYLTEGKKTFFKKAWIWGVDIMRTLPFLIFAYLLYYGLPSVDIRLSAWSSSIIALSMYHGAYFAEIFRGARSSLDSGQIDAARAHGYTRGRMVTYIILPQLFLRSGPVLANQLVYLLKDTAFLTIITVQELTGTALAVQATHFIPVQAFVIAIIIYWIVSILTDSLVKLLEKSAIKRGMGHAIKNTRG